MHANFQAGRHHAQRIVHSGLIVENKFLGQQMQDLAIVGQRNGAGPVDRLLDFVSSDFPRTRAQADAAVTIDAAHVDSADADDGLFHGSARDVFRGFDGFLNRRYRFVEFHDHAFARAARFSHSVPAIAQTAFGELRHQRASLRAAYVNRGKKTSLLLPHCL